MIASVHISDSSIVRAQTRRSPKVGIVPGLRWSSVARCAQLSPRTIPAVQPGRTGLVTWWDDDESLDAFCASEAGAGYDDGWSVRLRPTRSRAVWPKFDGDPFPDPNVRHDGIHTAITLGSSRPALLPRFLKVSSKLNEQFLGNRDGIWGTALTLPPLIAMTMTFWTDQDAVDAYTRAGAHGAAMKAHYDFPTDHHDFVSDGGFYGFQPYAFNGRLTGINPTPPIISGPLG